MALTRKTFDEVFNFSRGSTGTYFDENGVLQTASVDEPRFDHDPVAGEALGVLIEESRTNQVEYSEDLTAASWTPTSLDCPLPSIIADTIASPDGTTTADRVIFDQSGGRYCLIQDALSVTDGATITASAFMKSATGNAQKLSMYWASPDTVSNGGVVDVPATGWIRVSITVPNAKATDKLKIGLFNSRFDAGQDVADVYIWGIQLEQGSFPTSYIPTNGSSVTRSSDSISRTLGDEYIETSGTWVFDAEFNDSTIEDIGLNGAIFNGDGAVVYTFDGTEGKLFSNGALQFTNVSPENVVEVMMSSQTSRLLDFYPYQFEDADAISKATGDVTVDYIFANGESLVLDFAEQDYGLRDSEKSVGASRTSNLSDVVDFTRSSEATYFDASGVLRTAAIDEPRFDHDPVTGEPLGVLIEESRTNLVLHSGDLTQPSWTGLRATYSQGSEVSPDGSTLMTRVTVDAGETSFYIEQDVETGTAIAEKTFTVSFWFYSTDTKNANCRIRGLGATTEAENLPYVIEPGLNKYTFVKSFTAAADGTSIKVAPVYDSSYAAGDWFEIWGAQLEEGTFPTSYIPTNGSAVTRSADVPFRDFGDELSEAAATISMEFSTKVPTGTPVGIVSCWNYPQAFSGNRSFSAIISADGAIDYAMGSTYISPGLTEQIVSDGASHKFAITANGAGCAIAVDGVGESRGEAKGPITRMQLGDWDPGGQRHLNGHIKRLDYYPRAMSAAELEALTS